MAKVCLSIGYYKAFLKDAVTKSGTREEFPKIREEVLQNVTDRHFVDNEELLEILQPLGDLIGELEKSATTLADIIVQFLKLHLYYRRLNQRAVRNPFVEQSLNLLSNRYKQYFMSEIFPIVLFLTPKYRDFSTSRFYQKDWIIRQIIILAIKWKFSKNDCTEIAQDISVYSECELTEREHEQSVRVFWQLTIKYNKPTRTLVRYMFSIKGHGAPVETLFSSLSYSKPKIQNKMVTENLKIIGTVRKHLKKKEPIKGRGKRSRDKTKGVNTLSDCFLGPDEEEDVEEFDFVEAFENEILEEDDFDALLEDDDFDYSSDVQQISSCSSYFIDGLFDMDIFEVASIDVDNSNAVEDNEIDDEDIFTVDDILA